MNLNPLSWFKTKATTPVDHPANWLLSALGGESSSGVTVNPVTAMNCAAVLAAVNVLSQDIAKLPLLIYRRLPGGGREVATDHPLYPLLARKPNPWQSRFTFREQGQAHLLLRGNAYLLKVWNARGKISALIPLHPERVAIWVGMGEPFYEVARTVGAIESHYLQGLPARLNQEHVLHVPGLSLDGVTGVSAIHYARETIGLALATEQYGAKLFGQGARPSGTLTHPGKLSPEGAARLRESWSSAYSGVANAGKVAVLEEGMKFEALALSNEDAQFLGSRQFSIVEIARIFRLPPHKLMDLGRATWSNIEQMSMEYVNDSLMPWLERWEAALEDGLLQENERDTYFIEHDISRLLRGDSVSRSNYIKSLFYTGGLTVNEVRDIEGRNPIEGGERRYIPVNMAPLDDDGIPHPTTAATAGLNMKVGNDSEPDSEDDSESEDDAAEGIETDERPAGSNP